MTPTSPNGACLQHPSSRRAGPTRHRHRCGGWYPPYFLGLLLFLLPTAVIAAPAEKAASDRPRIGLVLSGGGARGLAHIGVLKVLEENHIPIDMIAGTSAGSIIAGLYAMGLSADEVENIIRGIDWNEGFSDESERKYRSIRRKQDDLDILSTLAAGVRSDGVHLPKGLLQGQRLELLLKRMAAGAELVTDFDRLPIPYRAIATNIENGKHVVIGKGQISRAMHASMALPGIYAPVEIDGKMLVDGGLSSNLPIKTVRNMGADIIIAVDISTPLSTADELTSLLSVAGQVTSLLTQSTLEKQLKSLNENDTLIRPELTGYSSADFDKTPEIIRIGEKAARDSLQQLKRYRIDAGRYQAYRSQIIKLSPAAPIIDEIIISSNSRLSQKRLAKYISIKPGDRFDRTKLEEDIAYLYGLDYFSYITYQLDKDEGQTSLLIDVHKKDWGPNYLRAGLAITGNFSGDNNVNIAVGLLATEINSLGAEWNTTLQFGARSGVSSEFFQPIGANSDYFVAAAARTLKRNVNLYQDGSALTTARLDEKQIALDFGRQFGNTTELRLGITRATGETEITTGPPVPAVKSSDGAYRLTLKHDTLDDANFPRRGSYGQLALSSSRSQLGADTNIDIGGFSYHRAISRGHHTVVGNIAYADTINTDTDGDPLNLHKSFQLGGFLSLSGYEQDELSGAYTALASLAYYRSLNHYFIKSAELPIYIGFSAETGNAWLERSQIGFDSLIYASSIFVGIDTYLGPLYIAYGFNSDDRQTSYLFLGRTF